MPDSDFSFAMKGQLNQGRLASIDIAKGIGIVLVVIGHLIGVVGSEPVGLTYAKSYLYQFHVPLFFFLSGLFFNPVEKWKPFLIKKIKRLYLPFVIANLIFLLCDIILRSINGITIIPLDDLKHAVKIVLQLAVSPMGGATWFLIALFRASIVFKLLGAFFKNNIVLFLICLGVGIFGMSCHIKYTVSASMVALMYYYFGFASRKIVTLFRGTQWYVLLLVLLIFVSVLVWINPLNQVDVSLGVYSSIGLAMLGSFFGIAAILIVSELIYRSDNYRWIDFLGQNTMSVLIGHFAAFKIIIIIQSIIFHPADYILLSHPCYRIDGFWWVAYIIAGLALPPIISNMRSLITSRP